MNYRENMDRVREILHNLEVEFLKRPKFQLFLILAISIIYFVLRLPNLTLQPIFADEAIYVRWAQVMRSEPTLRFLPLSDGKTPLFMWMMIPLFKIFDDPLLAGRFLSVISGYATLLGGLFLGWKFFNIRLGILTAFLIAITPYMVFFDRLALVDSMLAAFSIWSLNLALLIITKPRFDLAMVLGYLLGGGMLTKPPGFFSILSLPLTLLVFDWTVKLREKRLIKIFSLWVVAIIIAFGMYNILRLGVGFENLNSRNQDYVHSPFDVLTHPLDPLVPHLHDLFDFLTRYLTIPTFILATLGMVVVIWKKDRTGLIILAWGLFPLIVQSMLLKTYTARYLLFSIPPFLTLAAYGIDLISKKFQIKKNYLIVLMVIIFGFALNFNLRLLFNQATVPLPKQERIGYFQDWTAGYGFPIIAEYLNKQSKNGLVVVGTEGFFGTLPDGLQIYLDKNRDVVVVGSRAAVSDELRKTASEHPTYFVANKSRYPVPQTDLKLIMEFPKVTGGNDFPADSILFYQVFPGENEN